MSASLVGSEMCIRDRTKSMQPGRAKARSGKTGLGPPDPQSDGHCPKKASSSLSLTALDTLLRLRAC
eukprot:13388488-Alexandrium_andersonii.AAC.1